jgi:hypothetical protein
LEDESAAPAGIGEHLLPGSPAKEFELPGIGCGRTKKYPSSKGFVPLSKGLLRERR